MQNLTKHTNRPYNISRKLVNYLPKCTLGTRTVNTIKCTNLTWKNEKSRLLMPSSFYTHKQVCREFYTIRSLLLRSANDPCNFPKFNTVRNFSTSSVIRSTGNRDDKEHRKDEEDNKENKKDKQNEKEDFDPWLIFLKVTIMLSLPLTAYMMLLMSRSMNDAEDQMIKEISWQEFVYQMLLKGEVYKLDINKSYSTVIVHLYPGAVIDGKKRYMRCLLQVPDVDLVEEKIRKIEEDYGISPADSVPITYSGIEGSWNAIHTIMLFSLIICTWLLIRLIRKGQTKQEFNKFLDSYFGRRAKFTLVDPQNKAEKGIRFEDVAGLQEAKVEVMEFVDYLKQPDRYKVLGAKIPKGVLLLGPPGCGKTLLAKAIANEANVPFLSMNGSEFIEMLGGLGAARVRSLFEQAKNRAPCIIYIDEIDAIGKKRRDNVVGHDELGMTLNQLLVELDGMSPRHDVILLASTNRPEVLDRALLRRGRFDRHIRIDLPTLSERAEIFKTHLRSIKLDQKPEVYSGYLAHLTPGFTGADIANICNESALAAASHKKHSVSVADLTNAIDKVLSGTTKKSSVLSPSEKRIIAYREAGQVLAGWLLKHTDTFIKVSIVPTTRGKLGFSRFVESDKKIISKEQIFEEMCVNLAARAAENLIFGKISTAAKDELKKVTTAAYAQVKEFGMNSAVGLLSFAKNESDSDMMPYSKKLKNVVDHEARKIIAEACNKTNTLLRENKDKLIKIAEELLIKESLTYEDIEKLIGPPPFGKKKILSYEDFQKSPINLKGPPLAEEAAT